MKVLYLAPLLPAPSGSGGKRAIFNHILDLNESAVTIDILCVDVDDSGEIPEICLKDGSSLQIRKRGIPRVNASMQAKLLGIWNLLTQSLPRSIAVVSSLEPTFWISEQLKRGQYQCIVIDHLNGYGLIRGLNVEIPIIYIAHNLETAVLRHECARLGPFSARKLMLFLEIWKMERIESELLNRAAKVVAIGLADVPLIASMAPAAKVVVWPELPIAKAVTWRYSASKRLLFVGSAKYFPNRDAIEWLIWDLMPKIAMINPDVVLHIAGTSAAEFGAKVVGENVRLEGFVSDAALAHLHLTCDLFICPVILGAGIKIKVLEAGSYGLPVIATRISLEGIGFLDGASCDFSRTDKNVANKICDLLQDSHGLEVLSTTSLENLASAHQARGHLIECFSHAA